MTGLLEEVCSELSSGCSKVRVLKEQNNISIEIVEGVKKGKVIKGSCTPALYNKVLNEVGVDEKDTPCGISSAGTKKMAYLRRKNGSSEMTVVDFF